jgi:hypothetical protein
MTRPREHLHRHGRRDLHKIEENKMAQQIGVMPEISFNGDRLLDEEC